MKSILKLGIAAVLALTPAVVFAAAGDAFILSNSAMNPNAGNSLSFTAVGQSAPLYIWVTSSGAADDITPASTALTGGGSPTGAAALALNGSVNNGTATITGVQYYNYDPAVPATSIYQYTGGISRWFATTPTATITGSGTAFSNVEANTAMNSPTGTVYPAGTVTGLSRTSVGDPLYFPGQTVANGSTGGSWLLGQINFTAAAAGNSTLTLMTSPLAVTKSGPSTTTDLTTAYSYGTATITVSAAPPPLPGDANLDNKVDLADLNGVINNFGSNNPGGDAAHDGNPTGLSDLNAVINNFGAMQGAGSVAAVPEPASFGLLALGSVLALGYRARRRAA